MTRAEKLIEGIKPVLPSITEEMILETFIDNCEHCPISDYCDQYFFVYKDGKRVLDENGEEVVNSDMVCGDIVEQWLNEEFVPSGGEVRT